MSSSVTEALEVAAVVVLASSTVLVMTGMSSLVFLLRGISKSVGVAEPTEKQLEEEDPEKRCALFRHLPELSKNLAWRSLGAKGSTPIHVCTLPKEGNVFYLKREDLISDQYGGNKVRTLQHQLAVCEARRERGDPACKQLVSIGSGGSNQVIATVVHSRKLGWDNKGDSALNVCWFDKDEPDLDNTLNMLSTYSFPNVGFTFDWGVSPSLFRFLGALKGAFIQKDSLPMMLGGNCSAGVLGQVGGVMELAEQIEAGDSPDPERIYLPVGSSCTVSGLIMGTVLARHLGMEALSHPEFKIVGCNVHEGFAMMDRAFSLHTNPFFGFMPLTITHSVVGACRVLKQLGGPDLEAECRKFIKYNVELRADADVVGIYGAHSEKSRKVAQYYDENGIVTDYTTGKKEKELWVCGHFVSKAFQPLLKDLEAAVEASSSSSEEKPKYMLWQTKSAVQPKGPLNEWETMKEQNDKVKKWANEGKAESPKFRPGKVSMEDGKPEDYQAIMTKIAVN